MDFDQALDSISVRTQSGAALFLRAEGVRGAKYLPKLLRCCRAIDIRRGELDKFQVALLGFGAMTLGDVVCQIGFDQDNAFHIEVMNCIVELTSVANIEVAAYAINGLGCLGTTHSHAFDCLKTIVKSDPRFDEHPVVTCRAIAFRMLSRIDRSLAAEFRDTTAYTEYLDAVDSWLKESSPDMRMELIEEAKWLR